MVDIVHGLEAYGFLGDGAVFLADDAVELLREGQADVPVYDGSADDALSLLFKGEPGYGAGGANLSAEGAIVFAVSQPGYDDGHEQARDTRPCEIGVEGASQAHLHTLAAPDTLLEEITLARDARRAKETVVLFRVTEGERPGEEKARNQACEEDPLRHEGLPLSFDHRQEGSFPVEREPDTAEAAPCPALHTPDAVVGL